MGSIPPSSPLPRPFAPHGPQVPYDALPPSRGHWLAARTAICCVKLLLAGLYAGSFLLIYNDPRLSEGRPSSPLAAVAWLYFITVTIVTVAWSGIKFVWWLLWALTYEPEKHGPKEADPYGDSDFQ
jgi:hypothetical protein